jgi:hypothetical protein
MRNDFNYGKEIIMGEVTLDYVGTEYFGPSGTSRDYTVGDYENSAILLLIRATRNAASPQFTGITWGGTAPQATGMDISFQYSGGMYAYTFFYIIFVAQNETQALVLNGTYDAAQVYPIFLYNVGEFLWENSSYKRATIFSAEDTIRNIYASNDHECIISIGSIQESLGFSIIMTEQDSPNLFAWQNGETDLGLSYDPPCNIFVATIPRSPNGVTSHIYQTLGSDGNMMGVLQIYPSVLYGNVSSGLVY